MEKYRLALAQPLAEGGGVHDINHVVEAHCQTVRIANLFSDRMLQFAHLDTGTASRL